MDDWLSVIEDNEQANKLPIVLLATKSDLVDQRKVPVIHGEKKMKEIN